MLTGGLRTREVMQAVVADGTVDVVSMAQPLAVMPDLPLRMLAGEELPDIATPPLTGRKLGKILHNPWHAHQIKRMAGGGEPQPGRGLLRTARAHARANIAWQLGLSR